MRARRWLLSGAQLGGNLALLGMSLLTARGRGRR